MVSLQPGDPRHGTTNGYNNLGCRCDLCREAWRIYKMEYNRKRGVRPLDDVIAETTRHGIKRYTKGCRCESCRAAAAAQKRRNRARNAMACSVCGGTRLHDRERRSGTGLCVSCYRARGKATSA